jgi:cytochrome c-type biogenesis protein CcsB
LSISFNTTTLSTDLNVELSQLSNDSTISLNNDKKNNFVFNLNYPFDIPNISVFVSFISLCFLLIIRWKEFGHFPLSNLYESLIFLSLCCLTLHFITQNLFFSNQENLSNLTINFFGSITASTTLFLNAFASFSLPDEMQEGSALVPALQSNWLMMHVTVMITSYAALIIGSLFSIAYLVIEFILKKKTTLSFLTNNLILTLDNLSYRIIGLGFPLLTIGILSGAVWANEAWGSYWSWDPKETWALLTWLVFAIYLHTRITRGWNGQKSAIMASLGFVTVWICFLGVNLLGEGLHSYGFISK